MRQHLVFCIVTACLIYCEGAAAQSAAPGSPTASSSSQACQLIGADTVNAGSMASYGLTSCTAGQWSLSCGTIVSRSATSITVSFGSGSCSSTVLSATGGSTSGMSKNITILAARSLSAGTIAVPAQTVAYNGMPVSMQVAAASGGLCGGSYTYQWFSSIDSIHFVSIAGATGQNYQPGPLVTTTWYQRQATCSVSGSVNSSTIKVTVKPPLTAVLISPALQTINYNGTVTPLSILAADASLRFQWESATDPGFSAPTIITGATSGNYSPDSLSSTTFYRAVFINNGDSLYSSPAVVTVLPPLNAGTLLPATQTISTDSLPELLTCTGVNGGSGIFNFQWFSSPDGNNWTLLSGVQTAGYDPGLLTSTTWYQVQVFSNGIPVASSKAVIYVNP
jgi:hypothetical protein